MLGGVIVKIIADGDGLCRPMGDLDKLFLSSLMLMDEAIYAMKLKQLVIFLYCWYINTQKLVAL